MKTLHDKKSAEKIFEKWRSDFRTKPKGKDYIYENFNDLFYQMSSHFIDAEIAYEYVKLAAARHMPEMHIIDRTYATSPFFKKTQTKAEFIEGWKALIMDKAVQAFYDVYPLSVSKSESDKIQLPKGMSKKEYTLQRQHAREFPLLDTATVMEMYKKIQNESIATFEDLSSGDLNGKDKPRQD